MAKNEKQRREAQASYMKRWREKNPHARHNNNDKINKAKSIQCGCGGSYKDISHLRARHFATTKHRCWDAKEKIMPLYIEVGQHRDIEESSARIDAHCEKRGIYTTNDKLKRYEQMKADLQKKLQASEESEEESEEEVPVRETHYQKIIRLSLEQEYQEPKNIIMKVNETTPPTPCPTSSEDESEASEETEEESEGGDTEETTSDESEDETLIYRSKDELERDRQNALNRLKSFQAVEFAEESPSPPPKRSVNMGAYLEEASITPDTDPYGDKALEEIKQRFKFV